MLPAGLSDKILGTAALAFAAFAAAMPAWADPIHDAVRAGDSAAAEQLISAGADIAAPDEAGLPPVILAALAGDERMVALLISKGADPGAPDRKGFTALHAAAHVGSLEVVELLMSYDPDLDDQDNEEALTPLHLAAERDHRAVAEALLAGGADPVLRSRNGHSALFLAALKTHPDMIRLLLRHGAQCDEIRSQKFRGYCLAESS